MQQAHVGPVSHWPPNVSQAGSVSHDMGRGGRRSASDGSPNQTHTRSPASRTGYDGTRAPYGTCSWDGTRTQAPVRS